MSVSGSRYRLRVDGVTIEPPRVHAVLGVLDKPGLNTWKLKRVADAVANDPDVRALAEMGRSYEAVRTCLDTASFEMDLGSAVHLATEYADKGASLADAMASDRWPRTIGEKDVRPYLAEWERVRDVFGIEVVAIEQVVYNTTLDYAGTLDRVLRLAAVAGGAPIIADLKTGGVWPDHLLQLAAYANAEHWYDELADAPCASMHEVDRSTGVIVQLRPADSALYAVPLDRAWRALRAARAVFEWASIRTEDLIGEPLVEPEPEEEWPW